jgi:mRNA interferase RelE/StbE
VRKGLIEKFDDIRNAAADPRDSCKPLTGPLKGYFRVVYSRYRAIFSVTEEKTGRGEVVVHIRVLVVVVGIRKERDKNDVYRIAQRLIDLGVLPPAKNVGEE